MSFRQSVFFVLAMAFANTALCDDLRLGLTMEKASFHRGEPIIAWLSWENTGETPLIVSTRMLQQMFLDVREPHGQRLAYRGVVATYPAGNDGFVLLRAGEKGALEMELDCSFSFAVPGVYSVSLDYQLREGQRVDTARHLKGEPTATVFRDHVRTGTRQVNVADTRDDGLSLVRDDGGCWMVAISRKRRALAALSHTVLDPYRDLAEICFGPNCTFRAENLADWLHGFWKKYPSFDQPAYVYSSVARAIPGSHIERLDALRELAIADVRITAQHPVLKVIDERKRLLLKDRQKHKSATR